MSHRDNGDSSIVGAEIHAAHQSEKPASRHPGRSRGWRYSLLRTDRPTSRPPTGSLRASVISWDLGGFRHRQTLLDAPSQFFVAATDHQYLSPMAKEQELFQDEVRRTRPPTHRQTAAVPALSGHKPSGTHSRVRLTGFPNTGYLGIPEKVA